MKIKKLLVANRGEIALRVIRACREIGIQTVAVFSEADRESLHVRFADEAYLLGPAPAGESYLRADKILEIAGKTKVQAIHPGYGFLSENADFAEACRRKRIRFVGPSASSMRKLGDKISARRLAEAVKVPVVPGIDRPLKGVEEALEQASRIGYPVLLKARSGGGGKGMRKVLKPEEMESAHARAASEAKESFGDPALYLEKYLEEPHHVEVQILGDKKGRILCLGERECSAQRRHQKIIEESPSPFISEKTRRKLFAAAIRIARGAGYENAGTLEFLVDKKQNFYFLEMNTRLQVEHPVTEMVTGIDLVRAQIEIAEGKALTPVPSPVNGRGVRIHAIECRIYAEDPDNNFMPAPGRVEWIRNPEGPGVRVDSSIYPGSEIPIYYDPLIAKLITWGSDRREAILRMERALREYQVVGVTTNIPFHRSVMRHPRFLKGDYDTGFVEKSLPSLTRKAHEGFEAVAALAVWIHRQIPRVAESGSSWRELGRKEGLREF